MSLADYVTPEAVCMNLAPTRRDDALRALLDTLAGCGVLAPEMKDGAFDAVVRRELLGSTGIGNGVAVPHARVEGTDGVAMGIGLSRAGIQFHALDGRPVYMVFLVLGPKEDAEAYLSAMQSLTKLVQNADFRRFASQASSAQEVIELIEEMDQR